MMDELSSKVTAVHLKRNGRQSEYRHFRLAAVQRAENCLESCFGPSELKRASLGAKSTPPITGARSV